MKNIAAPSRSRVPLGVSLLHSGGSTPGASGGGAGKTRTPGRERTGKVRRMTAPALFEPPLLTRLRAADRILVAGAGGGFDVYAGLPIALALRAAGKEVHLANLSFSHLYGLDTDVWLAPDVAAIR